MALTEARKAYLAGWREANREKLREYGREWFRANKAVGRVILTPEERVARRRERHRRYRLEHPEQSRETQRRYREANRAKRRAACKMWRESHGGRSWAQDYRSQAHANWHAWRLRNGDRLAEKANRERLARLAAAGSFTPEQVRARVLFWGEKCWVCSGSWDAIDHVIPIARGGTNWPANLRPICTPCNSRKRDKHPREVSRSGGIVVIGRFAQSA